MVDKKLILETCKQILQQRIATAETAMKEAQESSNGEEKSSAGDKYETARAMGHLARDMNARQLVQARQELNELTKIDLKPSPKIIVGSLVQSNSAILFIAVGLGHVRVGDEQITVLSPQSPLAKQLLGKKVGDSIEFMQKSLSILSVA